MDSLGGLSGGVPNRCIEILGTKFEAFFPPPSECTPGSLLFPIGVVVGEWDLYCDFRRAWAATTGDDRISAKGDEVIGLNCRGLRRVAGVDGY